MSHFTVLVPAESMEELKERLAPYQENNMKDCPEEYLEFFDITDEVESYFKEYKEKYPEDYCTLEQYAKDDGYEIKYDGDEVRCGYLENPNARWDWWMPGGRWTGTLKLKARELVAEAANGSSGLLTPPNEDPTRCDTAVVADIDIDFHRNLARMEASELWKAWHDPSRPRMPVEGGDELEWNKWTFTNEGRSFFMLRNSEIDALNDMGLEEYANRYGEPRPITYAFIDLEGKWNERGKMGWWGMSDMENDAEYHVAFWKWIESLPVLTRLWVVDCHI